MKAAIWCKDLVLGGLLVLAPVAWMAPAGLMAQTGKGSGNAPSVTEKNSDAQPEPTEKLVTSTVHEAWLESGRNEDKFFNMVKQLAELSADKRHLTLPDNEAAGQRMGNAIKASARRDPDQLLYAVVDAAVKQTAGLTASAKTTSAKTSR